MLCFSLPLQLKSATSAFFLPAAIGTRTELLLSKRRAISNIDDVWHNTGNDDQHRVQIDTAVISARVLCFFVCKTNFGPWNQSRSEQRCCEKVISPTLGLDCTANMVAKGISPKTWATEHSENEFRCHAWAWGRTSNKDCFFQDLGVREKASRSLRGIQISTFIGRSGAATKARQ